MFTAQAALYIFCSPLDACVMNWRRRLGLGLQWIVGVGAGKSDDCDTGNWDSYPAFTVDVVSRATVAMSKQQ